MQERKQIIWYRRLGASAAAVMLTLNLMNGAAAAPHAYQYAEPDDSTASTTPQKYYHYVQPSDSGSVSVIYVPISKMTKEDQALTYPPLASQPARHAKLAAYEPIKPAAVKSPVAVARNSVTAQTPPKFSLNQKTIASEDKNVVRVIQTQLASAALLSSQASTEKAATFALAQTTRMELTGNNVQNFGTLSPAAGFPAAANGQEMELASASDALPLATLPAIAPLPSSIASPATKRSQTSLPPLSPKKTTHLIMPAPDEKTALSDESKQILDKLPPEKKHKSKKLPVAIDHFRKTSLEEEGEKKHEGLGIKISIRRPKADINQMLESAYQSLIAGNQEDAVEIYKQVLDEQPQNKLALFGLATTYHRAGQLQLARPLYGKLLALDPNNVEGLNNFLVLLSDESPDEALTELAKLEQTHSGFSPLPAQEAVIYEKMGQYDKAADAMNRAIVLSPENLKYRYDMAIILDKQGAWSGAAAFYQQLLTANDRGEKIPTNPEEIQERLTFIRSNKLKGSS